MTETPTARSSHAPYWHAGRSSAWRGWIVFAGIMLMVGRAFQVIERLVALFTYDYYTVSKNGLGVHVSYTGWGWALLVLAALNLFAGAGVLKGQTWARIWAIAASVLGIIVNLGFTAAYPIWIVMLVTLDVIIIFALSVHWDEVAD